MSDSLDMTLDDLIRSSKPAGRGGRGGGGRGGRGRGWRGGGFVGWAPGGPLRVRRGAIGRPSPYQLAKTFNLAWQQNLLDDSFGTPGRSFGIETGTKLYISNLDFGVSNEDIKELFSEAGDLKRCAIHYDRSGRSKGTAEVVFARRPDAVSALKRYNNVQLDGKPMKIELIGTNLSFPYSRMVNGAGPAGRGRGRFMMSRGRGRGFGFWRFRVRGRGRGRGLGRGRGWARDWDWVAGQGKPPTAEELDKDLEKYHADAMQTS